MRIAFMGTPDFAVPSLTALHQAGHKVVGVITQPDKPRGRGYSMTPPEVKVCAQTLGLPVLQPSSLKREEFSELLEQLNPELIVVVAYGKLLPPYVLDYPRYGCINVHGSLLPKYRGAAPIQRALMAGEMETGITTMYMAQGLDTGDMLLKSATEILPGENAGQLTARLSVIGAELLVETIRQLEAGRLTRIPQDGAQSTHAPKIEKSDCVINWNLPPLRLEYQIRALSPRPGAYTLLSGRGFKIYTAEALDGQSAQPDGMILAAGSGGLRVSAGGGILLVKRVQAEGSKELEASQFAMGQRGLVGKVFGN